MRAKRTADRSTRRVATCQFMTASRISHSIAGRNDIEITRIIAPPVCRWFCSFVKQTIPHDLSAPTRFRGKESPFKNVSIISRLRNQMVDRWDRIKLTQFLGKSQNSTTILKFRAKLTWSAGSPNVSSELDLSRSYRGIVNRRCVLTE